MAFLNETFDVGTLPQGSGSFNPLPPGWYTATITKADLTPTLDGSGQYIKMRYDITGPTHQGRVVFSNLNIKNKSSKAEEIGRQQLGEVMRAIGLSRVTDTDQLIGGGISIKLDIRPERTDQNTGKTYDASNEVKGFKAAAGSMSFENDVKAAESSFKSNVAAPASAAPASAARAAPWLKNK